MKTLLKYIQKNHVDPSNDFNLAEELALEIWSFCDNNELTDEDFILECDDYAIFLPKGMSLNDAKLLVEDFNKANTGLSVNQAKNIGKDTITGARIEFYLGTEDPKNTLTKKGTYILMLNTNDSGEKIRYIYMSFNVQDELFKISEKENENN